MARDEPAAPATIGVTSSTSPAVKDAPSGRDAVELSGPEWRRSLAAQLVDAPISLLSAVDPGRGTTTAADRAVVAFIVVEALRVLADGLRGQNRVRGSDDRLRPSMNPADFVAAQMELARVVDVLGDLAADVERQDGTAELLRGAIASVVPARDTAISTEEEDNHG